MTALIISPILETYGWGTFNFSFIIISLLSVANVFKRGLPFYRGAHGWRCVGGGSPKRQSGGCIQCERRRGLFHGPGRIAAGDKGDRLLLLRKELSGGQAGTGYSGGNGLLSGYQGSAGSVSPHGRRG